jgi:coenzyme F420-reducing hydrogenase delta subunit
VEGFLKSLPEKWGLSEAAGPRIVCFGCRRSAGTAWKEVCESEHEIQGAVEFLELPCAGKLDPDYVLKALSLGADGVLVLACPEENCKSQHGNTYARERVEEARHYLAETGLDPERIRFDSLSGNMTWYLKETLGAFVDRFREDPVSKPDILDLA